MFSFLFCILLFLSVVSSYQVYVYPSGGCRGTPQIVPLNNGTCAGFNNFYQIGICSTNSQTITVQVYGDDKTCKITPLHTIRDVQINTCTLDVVKYACIPGQVPESGTGTGTGTGATTTKPTTAGTTSSTPTSTSTSTSTFSNSTNLNQTTNAATTTTTTTITTNNITLTLTLTFIIFFVIPILTR